MAPMMHESRTDHGRTIVKLPTFLFKKQRRIEAHVLQYLERWNTSIGYFFQAMDVYLTRGFCTDFDFLVQSCHKEESVADDLRRQVEYEMFAKALLPESRGDILGFLENIDPIAGRAERVLFFLTYVRIELPEQVHEEMRKLVELTREIVSVLHGLAQRMFERNPDHMREVKRVDKLESRCDHVERDLLRLIFADDGLSCYDKLLLRELILKVASISDMVEHMADRLTIMTVKRRV